MTNDIKKSSQIHNRFTKKREAIKRNDNKMKKFFRLRSKKMNEIFKNYSYVRAYIDDLIVFNLSFEKHLQHFSSIFAFFQH